MCWKILFQRTLWKPACSAYLLMSVNAIASKKSLLFIWKVLKLFVNALIKVRLHRTLWQAPWWTATSTVQVWRTPPLTVIDRREGNCVRKNLSYWYAKSEICFLTQWLAVTGIPFVVERIYNSHLRCEYLTNKKFFLIFFCIFEIYIKFWTFSKKRTTS